jgi:DNA-binding NtrC family response regulator
MCEMLEAGLGRRGFTTLWRTSTEDALNAIDTDRLDAAITDLRLPGMDGVALCRQLAVARPGLPVILMTAFGSFDAAVAAFRAGAYDVIAKPLDIDELSAILATAIGSSPAPTPAEPVRGLVGESAAMRRVSVLVEQVARTDSSVLLVGETGTGKELVARAIHDSSPRRAGPFVSVNCAALPEPLAESELFGHAKGAFTDASSDHVGLFARSNGGTLFLDEVSELPLRLQSKILRALEERVVLPVGATTEQPLDIRIITASNRDLELAVGQGQFRLDLLYRLQVIQIELPPLRERGDDVILLANHFLGSVSARRGLSPQAIAALRSYSWPGNVRELRNSIERATVVATHAELVLDDLPQRIRDASRGEGVERTPMPGSLHEVERQHIVNILREVHGNRALAARILGIGRKTLYRKLEAYGLAARR